MAWTVMGLIVLITLPPFYWILRTALSSNSVLAGDPANPLPVDFTLGGFERALGLQSAEEAIAQGGAGDGLVFRTLPSVNAWVAARYTLPGIVAHESARQGGVRLEIPDFGDAPES